MSADVLLLNRNFYAIQVTSWQRALSLVYLDRALVVDEEYRTYDFESWLELSQAIAASPSGFAHTPSWKIAIPEVVALRMFERVPRCEMTFTRRNIYRHYGYRCCYCGKRFPSSELNLDHILPRSRGGRTDWYNVVTSCIPCNLRKGSRLPHEAGMKLLLQPSRPRWQNNAMLSLKSPFAIKRSWQKFVDMAYWDSQLED